MKFSLGKFLLPTYVALAFVFTMIPIAYTFVFSFNKVEKSNIAWKEFTFDNWLNMCGQPVVCEAFGNSVAIAIISTLISTALGTAIDAGEVLNLPPLGKLRVSRAASGETGAATLKLRRSS